MELIRIQRYTKQVFERIFRLVSFKGFLFYFIFQYKTKLPKLPLNSAYQSTISSEQKVYFNFLSFLLKKLNFKYVKNIIE